MKKLQPVILVVDDNEDERLLLKNAFEKVGVEGKVELLSDGAEAIQYMMGEGKYEDRQRYPYPTFILTDLKMPGGDGFAVLDFLRSNPEWAVIPTIVLSGSADLDDIRTAYMLGASSYHVKPATRSELLKLVSTLYTYWMTCEVPEVDPTGRQLRTIRAGKLGERFPQLWGDQTRPHRPD